jgi:hypothetical protein
MATFTLTLDSADAQRRIGELGSKAPRIIARALNRSITSARAAMAGVVARDMGLKVGDVREKIRLREASPNDLRATLYASAKPLPLIDFKATGPVPSRGRGRGVSAVMKGARQRYPNAFIAIMPTGHKGVFARRGKNRLPIRELFGVSIAYVFKKHESVGLERAKEQLAKNLAHEFQFELSRA